MAVKIRLMRIGTNRQPFYRVVAVDERKKRTGGYLELLGTYNPLSEPKEINLDQGKIDAWIKKGAIPSYGFLRIIGKAPQKLPRKAKKAPKEAPAAAAPAAPAETPVEEKASEETQSEVKSEVEAPAEEPKPETETATEQSAPHVTPEQPADTGTAEKIDEEKPAQEVS